MATAKQVISGLSGILGVPYSTIEAYSSELRRVGWWPKTKRGRGAVAMSDNDAAKLLLAILAHGPKSLAGGTQDNLTKVDGSGFFIRHSDMLVRDTSSPDFLALKSLIGISDDLRFLDLISAILTHLKENSDGGVFSEKPFFASVYDSIYKKVEVLFAVSGPYPSAEFRCFLKDQHLKKLIADGILPAASNGILSVGFVHEVVGHLLTARRAEQDTKPYADIAVAIRSESERGLSTRVGFGGRELLAVARELRRNVGDS